MIDSLKTVDSWLTPSRVLPAMFLAALLVPASSVPALSPAAATGDAAATGGRAEATKPRGAERDAIERGYRYLTEKAYLPADFDQETFDAVWQAWPEPLRRRAAEATPERRWQMSLERYGLTERPDEPGKPLQYVVDDSGAWTMNCFSCHGGTVYGRPYPGAPNNRFALQTLTEEIRATKLRLGKPLGRMDLGSLLMPLGTTHGTTNAVMFGVGLMHFRDADLNVIPQVAPPHFTHHDMDAPPWWHFHRKESIYIDGFAPRGHRGLMQFMLVRENGPERFHEWESDFEDVDAYLMSLRPPEYPGTIDESLAKRGERLFREHCATCHGSYGDSPDYPGVRVPLGELGTDPVRLEALSVEGRQKYADSWFAHAGEPEEQPTEVDPEGYQAPPLDGVWASAPYLHNGSVPTLWHLLNPGERPAVWRRVDERLDERHVGLLIEQVERVPLSEPDPAVRRQYFDTRRFGKSNAGHEYPDVLSREEKWAVLEYLKTL